MYFLEGFEDRYESVIGKSAVQQSIEGLAIQAFTITKRPGDKFGVRFTLLNNGNVNLTLDIEVYAYLKGGSETTDRAFYRAWQNETLNVNQSKKYPPDKDWEQFDVTNTIRPGIYNCVLRIIDKETGSVIRRTEITDAWNVSITKGVTLTAFEVA